MPIKVLFVCLGNICRSPMAEGVFRHLAEKKGLASQITCASAGTAAYHIGELPDQRMRKTALAHGIKLESRARQFKAADFSVFDYIVPMDASNYQNIVRLAASEKEKKKVMLMRNFDENRSGSDVPDPYYGDMEGFEEVYRILEGAAENLLGYIEDERAKK